MPELLTKMFANKLFHKILCFVFLAGFMLIGVLASEGWWRALHPSPR